MVKLTVLLKKKRKNNNNNNNYKKSATDLCRIDLFVATFLAKYFFFFYSVLLSQLPLKSDLQWNGAAVGQWCKHLLEVQLV